MMEMQMEVLIYMPRISFNNIAYLNQHIFSVNIVGCNLGSK